MKKRILMIVAVILATFSIGSTSYANNEPELIKMHATAYCLPGKTCTGKEVRIGLCATGRREWIGKTAILYQRLPNGEVGEIVGIYEIEDTGCSESVIDCWYPDLDQCQDFMNRVYEDNCQGRVYVQIIDAVG